MCQQTAEYLVPCSTQSQFPYLWSAALHCTHGMAILGDPGADEMGVPSRSCNPRERNWDRPPPKAIGISTRAARVYPVPGALLARFQPQCPPPRAQLGSPPPPPPGAEPRPAPPGFTPPLPHSQRVSSCSGDPREHNCYHPPPPPDQNPDPRRPGSPRPWRAPGALPTSTRGSR